MITCLTKLALPSFGTLRIELAAAWCQRERYPLYYAGLLTLALPIFGTPRIKPGAAVCEVRTLSIVLCSCPKASPPYFRDAENRTRGRWVSSENAIHCATRSPKNLL